MNMIETKKLTKQFGDHIVVKGLDVEIAQGESFALLGTNGAGKSTIIKMLSTLLPPSSGTALINGFDINTEANKVRRVIGYVPQLLSVDGTLTGKENLLLFSQLYDVPAKESRLRVMEALSFMGLDKAADRLVKEYSGGMIRRLEIAQSIMHRPKVLFMDEPTVGLDPIACSTVWEHILQLKQEFNTTIMMTTHIMDEVVRLCNRAAFLSGGRLVVISTPDELIRSIGKPGSTLEDAFIHYSRETVSEGNNYNRISLERKTAKRLG
jgi:ABC-2 type transport system ATP-binding protein